MNPMMDPWYFPMMPTYPQAMIPPNKMPSYPQIMMPQMMPHMMPHMMHSAIPSMMHPPMMYPPMDPLKTNSTNNARKCL